MRYILKVVAHREDVEAGAGTVLVHESYGTRRHAEKTFYSEIGIDVCHNQYKVVSALKYEELIPTEKNRKGMFLTATLSDGAIRKVYTLEAWS